MPIFINRTGHTLRFYLPGSTPGAAGGIVAPGDPYESDYESMLADEIRTSYSWVRILKPEMDVLQTQDPPVIPSDWEGDWWQLFYSRTYRRLVLWAEMQYPVSGVAVYRTPPRQDIADLYRYYIRFPDGGRIQVEVHSLTEAQRQILNDYFAANPEGSLTVSRSNLAYQDFQPTYPTEGGSVPVPTTTTTSNPVPPAVPNTDEQKRVRAVMEQLLATRSLKQAESLIQCGIEFEFHALNGKERGQIGDIDEALLSADLDRHVRGNIVSEGAHSPQFVKWLVGNLAWPSSSRCRILKALISGGLDYTTALTGTIRDQIELDISGLRDTYLNSIRSEYLHGPNRMKYIRGFGVEGWDRISAYTQFGDDGSVRGGEIRTTGPRTIPEVLTACRVLSENKFTVEENTSLHIHMSVKGIKHAYGQRFQAELYAYLLRNLHRMPESVRTRIIAANGCKKWAKLLLSTEKYSAVHFSKEHGTWEFRLFGNTQDYREMRTCLQLSYEALKHAYAVKLRKSPSLLGKATTAQIQSVLQKLMDNPERFWDTLEADTTPQIEADAA